MYSSSDIDVCRRKHHRFQPVWSDKTPMKMSLICIDCSLESGTNCYVGYGEPMKSWGLWLKPRRQKEVAEDEE